MNQITIDQDTSTRFGTALHPVQVVDEAGRLLGHFVPATPVPTNLNCPYSNDQLASMRNESDGRPLREIWEALDGQ